MGCDIHTFVLKKNKDNIFEELALYTYSPNNGEGCFKKAYIGKGRNYTLFSKLAGIRGCEEEISAGHDGLVDGCPENIEEEYRDMCHTPKYFRWDELVLAAKYEGMTKYNDIEQWNVVEDWIKELRVILDAYWVFDTENIYIQIFFDS